MSTNPRLGMRGTGDWATNERPENWRQMILYLYPNGSAPLTALMSMMGSQETDDPIFHWWTKKLPLQGGAVTSVHTDANLSAAASGAYAAETVIYAKVAEAVAKEFRVGHTAKLSKDGNHNYNLGGRVIDRLLNSGNSYVAVKLVEAATSTYDVASVDNIDVIGNSNPEGAEMPSAISYDPVEYSNFTQIFRTALAITDTSRQTRLRTGDAYMERKRETLELHAIEIEKGMIDGPGPYSTVGANNKPERLMQGLKPFVKQYAPAANVANYQTAAGFGGTSWTAANGGRKWLNERLEAIFRHGSDEKLGLIGTQGLLAINRLAETFGTLNITPTTLGFGIRVLQWITPFGTLFLKTHPLFNQRSTTRRDLLITEPRLMKYRHVRNRDTRFIEDPRDNRNRNNSRDGTEEEFITEASAEWHHPDAMGYLSGLGLDATTSA